MKSTTTRIGARAELILQENLLSQGWDVYLPLAGCSSTDVLAFKDGVYRRIQAKSCLDTTDDKIVVSGKMVKYQDGKMRSVRYRCDEFDTLAAVAVDRRLVAYVSVANISRPDGTVGGVTLRFTLPLIRPRKGFHLFSDYEEMKA